MSVLASYSNPPVIEKFYPISPEEREAEKTALASVRAHFASVTGSMRDAYDAMTAATPIANGISMEEVAEDDIKGWWVRPEGVAADRAILFLHGGAYTMGSAEAYRGLASQLAVRAGVAAFVLDYPLAPEHPFPAAFNAAAAARHWLGDHDVNAIAVVGDSAGGALALGAMEVRGSKAEVSSVVVFSPWVDLSLTGKTYNDPDTYDPIFQPPAILAHAARTYLAGADPADERASPLFSVPQAMAPLFIQVGADELLLDDARRYAAFASDRGGEVRLDIYEGLHHVFQRSVVELEGARHALQEAAVFINRHW